MLFPVAGCHSAYKFGTSEQLLWIRDGIEHAKEKWYFRIYNREPCNGPLNQLLFLVTACEQYAFIRHVQPLEIIIKSQK